MGATRRVVGLIGRRQFAASGQCAIRGSSRKACSSMVGNPGFARRHRDVAGWGQQFARRVLAAAAMVRPARRVSERWIEGQTQVRAIFGQAVSWRRRWRSGTRRAGGCPDCVSVAIIGKPQSSPGGFRSTHSRKLPNERCWSFIRFRAPSRSLSRRGFCITRRAGSGFPRLSGAARSTYFRPRRENPPNGREGCARTSGTAGRRRDRLSLRASIL